MKNKKRLIMIIAAVCASLIFAVCVFAAPGDEDDPLISLSYIIDTVIPELKEYVDEKVASIGGSEEFEVVNVEKGKSVICEKSANIIMRMGSAQIIATQKGGIADVTIGEDLQNGVAVPSNHLLIVPLSDGRGVKVTKDAIFMIKGKYEIK